jgi:hypothetical protein
MRLAILILTVLVAACGKKTEEPAAPVKQEVSAMTGATSPNGDKHPGEIVNEDKTNGKTSTIKAEEVPQSFAWKKAGGKWVPVVRTELSATSVGLEAKAFGPGNQLLESTLMSPPK